MAKVTHHHTHLETSGMFGFNFLGWPPDLFFDSNSSRSCRNMTVCLHQLPKPCPGWGQQSSHVCWNGSMRNMNYILSSIPAKLKHHLGTISLITPLPFRGHPRIHGVFVRPTAVLAHTPSAALRLRRHD